MSGAVWLAVAAAGVIAWYAYDLPDIARLERAGIRKPVVTIEAADGSVLARYGQVHGKPVDVQKLPPYLPRAFLAIEDTRFYSHPGVDVFGILRAAFRNLSAGAVREGGSTITQQLAKNLFLTRARTLRRKIQETLLAIWLERRFTKDQILSIYLNRVYFGGGAYGVDAAARRYFGRPAATVTLFQAAVLAGLVKAPSRDNPVADPKRAAARANLVLARMAKAGWIDSVDRRRARRSRVEAAPGRALAVGGRYFSDWVLDRVDDYVGLTGDDLTIRTTLDPRLQKFAQPAVCALVRLSTSVMIGLGPEGS